ncbi:Histidine phosphatase superfamily clade-2 [Trinorchestia longiramus]|nr:Histidine phosphatase superfamily clade-2 [Trinorchestia longiramus]
MWSFAVLHLYFVIIAVVGFASGKNGIAEKTVKQVHVLYRHGDRAPISSFPLAPHNSESLWPNGFAQLTKEGLQRQQQLGEWLRSRYSALLSSHWNTSEIEVRSTSVDRTLNSAQANLQGLYAGMEPDRRFDKTLNWSPVPVYTAPSHADQLLNLDDWCPRIPVEVSRMEEDPAVAALTAECAPLFELLTAKLGQSVHSIVDVDFVHDYFKILLDNDYPLPEWLEPHWGRVQRVAEFSFEMLGYTTELKRLRAGPLLRKIIDDMKAKLRDGVTMPAFVDGSSVESKAKDGLDEASSGDTTPNFYMYSAHDTTVAVNLQALGLYNHMSPPYAATVIYELHLKQGRPFVKLLYHNESGSAHVMTLPHCEELCPLAKFEELLSPLLPVHLEAECQVGPETPAGEEDSVFLSLSTLLSFSMSLDDWVLCCWESTRFLQRCCCASCGRGGGDLKSCRRIPFLHRTTLDSLPVQVASQADWVIVAFSLQWLLQLPRFNLFNCIRSDCYFGAG